MNIGDFKDNYLNQPGAVPTDEITLLKVAAVFYEEYYNTTVTKWDLDAQAGWATSGADIADVEYVSQSLGGATKGGYGSYTLQLVSDPNGFESTPVGDIPGWRDSTFLIYDSQVGVVHELGHVILGLLGISAPVGPNSELMLAALASAASSAGIANFSADSSSEDLLAVALRIRELFGVSNARNDDGSYQEYVTHPSISPSNIDSVQGDLLARANASNGSYENIFNTSRDFYLDAGLEKIPTQYRVGYVSHDEPDDANPDGSWRTYASGEGKNDPGHQVRLIESGKGIAWLGNKNDNTMEVDKLKDAQGNTIPDGGGNDYIDGGAGNDTLGGGKGNDRLIGGAGNDTLIGGEGMDRLEGGEGFDTYIINPGDGYDTVYDSDGSGVIKFGTLEAKGSVGVDSDKWIHPADSEVWVDRQTSIVYIKSVVDNETRISVIKGGSIALVRGWNESGLGIVLGEEDAPSLPEATLIYMGDQRAPLKSDEGTYDWRATTWGADGTLIGGVSEANFNDVIYGSGGADKLEGLGGNDALDGGAGDDLIYGGTGDDLIAGGAGSDVIYGGTGNDLILSATNLATPQRLRPSDRPSDFFIIGPDITIDRQGSTWLDAAGGEVYGGGSLSMDAAPDVIYAGDGNDHVTGGRGNDMIDGGDDDDILYGHGGNDVIVGGNGNDHIYGDGTLLLGYYQTTLVSEHGDDILIGGAGNDVIYGGGGDDILLGGTDDDRLFGDDGNDVLFGGIGVDYLEGGDGDDYLDGGADDDNLLGGDGNDTLVGGAGADYMNGGAGDDRYVLEDGDGALSDSGDTIIDTEGSNTIEFVSVQADSISTTWGGGLDVVLQYGVSDYVIVGAGLGGAISSMVFSDGTRKSMNKHLREVLLTNTGTTGNTSDNLLYTGEFGGVLAGLGGDDTLMGGMGDDQLNGGDGNDYLVGGAGNDTLVGGDGSDTYLFNLGDGVDSIHETNGTLNADIDVLRFGSGIKPGDITVVPVPGNLELRHANGVDKVVIGGWYDTTNGIGYYQIDRIEFADGTLWTQAYLNALFTVVEGTDGNDVLVGGGGRDVIYGYAGDDTLKGGDGNDVLIGGLGADRMEGGLGDDEFYVDNVGDSVIESSGSGVDTVNSTVTFSLASNVENLTLTGSAAIDGTGNSLDNILIGNDGDNTLTGSGGDDVLDGGAGVDILKGGSGNDTYIIRDLLDSVVESDGNGIDTVKASISYDLAWVNSIENITLTGTADINGTGDDGTNILIGNSGRNTLIGLGGSDTLDGGAGADTLIGGTGNDTYIVDDAGDVVIELSGEGTDTIVSTVNYVLPDNVEKLILTGSTAIYGKGNALNNTLTGNDENNILLGGAGTDTLLGGTGDDILDGGTGNDRLEGGAGNDTYYVDSGSDNLIELPGEGVDSVFASVNFTLDAELENLTLVEGSAAITGAGNELDNTLIGNSADNTLLGNDGNDYIDGGAGADDMRGGYGDDVFIVDNIGDTVTDSDKKNIGTAMLPIWVDGGLDTVLSSVSFTLSSFVENMTLTGSAAINGTGNGKSNILIGNNASNILTGNGGDDILDGSAGADILIGGNGNDAYYVDNASDIVTELSGQGTDTVMSSITFALPENVENLTLIGGADINGTGNALNNILTGNTGINTLAGKGGNDTYYVQNTNDVVIELANEGTDTVYSTASFALSDNVENLTLTGTNAINASGNGLNNILAGNSAANILDGGAGSDTMIGGMGDDTYVIDTTGDKITELAGEGVDSVLNSITYTLGVELENLTLTGTANINGTGTDFDNVLIGNDGNNTLTGKGGNDTLIGGGGADTLAGGSGDDTYIIDDLSDTITESSGNGVDTVISSIDYILVNNVENLVLTGAGHINGTGNTGHNVLTGNSGNNTLNGLSGNDTLDGGQGADTLIGGTGNDTYIVDDSGDVVIEASGAGTDTVQSWINYTLTANVENLTLTGAAHVSATGNTLNNILTGNAGNNVLDGAGGSDTYYGGAGDDTYVIDSTGDKITELIGEGVDTVLSSITYTLGAELENLTLTGSASINGTGNSANNTLIGNSANNTLTGGAGNDRLDGGLGNDTMIGGTGNDTYVVNVSTDIVTELAIEGTDTVESSVTLTLGNNVENLTLTGATAINGTGNTLNNVLKGNSAVNSLSGAAGNDTLDGGAGADTLTGGTGNDTYILGRGYAADTIVENDATAGNTDIAQFLTGVAADQIWFQKVGNNLETSIIGTSDKLVVKDWYLGNAYHVEQFKTTDGAKTLLDSNVANLVNAMASFAPPAAGQTTLPTNYQTSLAPVIAANWQ